jgi:hypothetical protein
MQRNACRALRFIKPGIMLIMVEVIWYVTKTGRRKCDAKFEMLCGIILGSNCGWLCKMKCACAQALLLSTTCQLVTPYAAILGRKHQPEPLTLCRRQCICTVRCKTLLLRCAALCVCSMRHFPYCMCSACQCFVCLLRLLVHGVSKGTSACACCSWVDRCATLPGLKISMVSTSSCSCCNSWGCQLGFGCLLLRQPAATVLIAGHQPCWHWGSLPTYWHAAGSHTSNTNKGCA